MGSYLSTSFYLSRPAPLVPHLPFLSSRCQCAASSVFRGVGYHPASDSMLSLQFGSISSQHVFIPSEAVLAHLVDYCAIYFLPYFSVGDSVQSCRSQRPSCHFHFCRAHFLLLFLGHWPCLRSVESHKPYQFCRFLA